MENEEKTSLPSLENSTPDVIAKEIVSILDDKKAQDIKLLAVRDNTVIADYFVICTGTSNTQIKALSGELEYKLEERGLRALHIDGYETGTWIVMDYAHVIVHIFHREQREFYKLERLWSDVSDILSGDGKKAGKEE